MYLEVAGVHSETLYIINGSSWGRSKIQEIRQERRESGPDSQREMSLFSGSSLLVLGAGGPRCQRPQ